MGSRRHPHLETMMIIIDDDDDEMVIDNGADHDPHDIPTNPVGT